MTRKEAERLNKQMDTLRSLGFTSEEAEALRRISMTLHRWHELECGSDNGCIERDEQTGKAYWRSDSGKLWPTADREAGALKRLQRLMLERNKRNLQDNVNNGGGLSAYIQTDPRGAALYIIRPGDVPAGEDVGAYYNRGICVY
jgi:hypothetical protein